MRVAILFAVLLLCPLCARAQLYISGNSQITAVDGDTTQVGVTYTNWDSVSRQKKISVFLMGPLDDSLRIFFLPPTWTIETIPGARGSHGVQPATWSGGFALCAQGQGRAGGIVYAEDGGGANFLFYVSTIRRPGVRLGLDHDIRLGTADSFAVLTVSNVRSDSQLCVLTVDSLVDARFTLSRDTLLLPPASTVADTVYYEASSVRRRTAQIHCHSHSPVGDSLQSTGISGEKSLCIHAGSLAVVDTGTVEVSIDTFTTIAVRIRNDYRDSITITRVAITPYTYWFEWLNDSLYTLAPDSSITLHIRRNFDVLRSYPPRPVLNVQFGVGFMFADSLTSDKTVVVPTRFKPFNAGYASFFGADIDPLHFVYSTPYSPTSWNWALYNASEEIFFADTVFIANPHFTVHSHAAVVFPRDTLRIHASIAGGYGNYYSALQIKGHYPSHDTSFRIPVAFGLSDDVAGIAEQRNEEPTLQFDPGNRWVRLHGWDDCTVTICDVLGRVLTRVTASSETVTLPGERPLLLRVQGWSHGKPVDIRRLIP